MNRLFRKLLKDMDAPDRENPDSDQEESFDDARVEFLANYVTRSLKVSEAKWRKMESEEENQRLIHE